MARPKKNSSIRQKEFINAAQHLFFSKGYYHTSVKDILDKVNDRSLSPSVFYYYFKSKEDIYHKVMENYIEHYILDLESLVKDDTISFEVKINQGIEIFMKTLEESRLAIHRGPSLDNRFFILDLQDRIMKKMIPLWEIMLKSAPWISSEHIQRMSRYITGGIGEFIYDFVFSNKSIFKDEKELTTYICKYTLDTLKAPEEFCQKVLHTLDHL
ncbi:MAG: TetR/AcrR family transcriptional regulator [Tissierellia bacterium]|nr:TetR/AcrR family transcriptional regulator [Tissierellia bacterium]